MYSITVLCGVLNSAQSNQSFTVESIVMTKLLFRVDAWRITRNPLNRLYKHTLRLVLSVCLLIGSGNGSTLNICRRGQGRIKTNLTKLQISACCDDVHSSPQLDKSGTSTGVSINSTAGRPSGWAVPRILVMIAPTIDISPQKAVLTTQQWRPNVIKIKLKSDFKHYGELVIH